LTILPGAERLALVIAALRAVALRALDCGLDFAEAAGFVRGFEFCAMRGFYLRVQGISRSHETIWRRKRLVIHMLRKFTFLFAFSFFLSTAMAASSVAQETSQSSTTKNAGEQQGPPITRPVLKSISDEQLREVVRQAIKPYMYGPEETLHDYKYRMLVTTQELDKNLKPDPKETDLELFEVKPVDGRPEEKLLERNGKPLTEKELDKQERDASKSRKARNRGVERAFIFGPEFMDAMDFELVQIGLSYRFTSIEELGLVIRFSPKKNPPKLKNDILKSLAGTLWVNVTHDKCVEQDCAQWEEKHPLRNVVMTKYEMHLIKPVRLLGGIVISVSDMHLEVEMTPVQDKTGDETSPISWLPKKMDIFLQLRFFGIKVRPKITREYSQFERVLPRVIHGKELTPKK
jgi:hypothetical protein